jgi:hypothetical protein
MPVVFRGWSALSDFPPPAGDWIFGFILTLLGLVLIGLPAAKLVTQREWPVALQAILLLGFGAAGGGLVAVGYVLLLGIGGGDIDLESFKALPAIALFGISPGLIVALVWTAFNFDYLANGRRTIDA